MDQIVYDESGTLLSGYFYRFDVSGYDDPIGEEPDETWVVAKRTPTADELSDRPGEEQWTRAEIGSADDGDVGGPETRHDCPVNPDHVTHFCVRSGSLEADLSGGRRVSDFVPDPGMMNFVVSAPFAAKLRKSGLTGFDLGAAKLGADRRRPPGGGDPELSVLRFRGRNCERPWKVAGAENACPFCGHKPLVCPVCGHHPSPLTVEGECPDCGRQTWVASHSHEGPGDRRLKISARWPQAGPILSGKWWDGSDFIGSDPWFVTKRAVDWLLSVHAAPFYAEPIRVCVDGMTDEQRKRLEAAKRPVG